MNKFKPGDKARVMGEVIDGPWNELYLLETPNGSVWAKYCDLEPIEPVQEEESPWRANMREAEKLVFAARINFQMHHAKEAENDKIDSFLYEAGIEIFNAMDAELESTISRLKSEIEELKRKA